MNTKTFDNDVISIKIRTFLANHHFMVVRGRAMRAPTKGTENRDFALWRMGRFKKEKKKEAFL